MTAWRKYSSFVRGVSVNRIGRTGVVLTTSAFITMILLELARLSGLLTNSYVGLLTYLVLPVLFVIGLILIPIGWRRYRAAQKKATEEALEDRFSHDETAGSFWGSKLMWSVGGLTAINVLFLAIVSTRMLAFMDSPEFCGTACHSVMNPEWVTYQQSPHARVRCIDCHVGEGVDALVDSKLNGLWQMVSVTFDLLERPIPTPVHNLRPARETCEKCHWPEKFYGNRMKQIVRFANDSVSTPSFTTLALKVDAGSTPGRAGIHWHVAAENEVRYASVNDQRQEMIWVDVLQGDGQIKRYANQSVSVKDDKEEVRTVDCIDCHNRATHIYKRPDDVVDELFQLHQFDRSIPFLKREALHALTIGFPDSAAADEGIANQIQGYYQRHYPKVAMAKLAVLDKLAGLLQREYHRYVHAGMNISWGAYPSHIGHRGETGCFRCHNPNLVAEDGSHIGDDCTLCHSLLAYDSHRPFDYLMPVDSTVRDSVMHNYLQREFQQSLPR